MIRGKKRNKNLKVEKEAARSSFTNLISIITGALHVCIVHDLPYTMIDTRPVRFGVQIVTFCLVHGV